MFAYFKLFKVIHKDRSEPWAENSEEMINSSNEMGKRTSTRQQREGKVTKIFLIILALFTLFLRSFHCYGLHIAVLCTM